MKNLNCNEVVELGLDEMIALEGGSKLMEILAFGGGWFYGQLVKIQMYSGDNGQWMA